MNIWGIYPCLDPQMGSSSFFNILDNPHFEIQGCPASEEVGFISPCYPQQSALGSSFGVGYPVPSRLAATPNVGETNLSKNFLIFDHTVNRTSLFVSALSQRVANLKSTTLPTDLNGQENAGFPAIEDKSSWRELDQDVISGVEKSEMREDTEELDALLYSDDDADEDEEASTGHSPLSLYRGGNIEVVCDNDEVSTSPAKRKRLDESIGRSLTDTACSGVMKMKRPNDDEGSSCAGFTGVGCYGGDAQQSRSWLCGSYNRAKEDRINETVCMLRKIIPESEGKEATVVIDEAIKYLTSLKVKITTLGVGEVI